MAKHRNAVNRLNTPTFPMLALNALGPLLIGVLGPKVYFRVPGRRVVVYTHRGRAVGNGSSRGKAPVIEMQGPRKKKLHEDIINFYMNTASKQRCIDC